MVACVQLSFVCLFENELLSCWNKSEFVCQNQFYAFKQEKRVDV